jgi:hypothetical protein
LRRTAVNLDRSTVSPSPILDACVFECQLDIFGVIKRLSVDGSRIPFEDFIATEGREDGDR